MTNGNEPINSIPDLNTHPSDWYGLTKREYFAIMAMQSFIIQNLHDINEIPFVSISMADALIKQLNNQQ